MGSFAARVLKGAPDALWTPTPPDLIDASGTVLKTNKEKGSALLQRFIQQSNQNNLDERKAIWKGLDRTLTEADSNDDLMSCGVWQKTSTRWLVLWHQLDWTSELHGCWSLKKKKKRLAVSFSDFKVLTNTDKLMANVMGQISREQVI